MNNFNPTLVKINNKGGIILTNLYDGLYNNSIDGCDCMGEKNIKEEYFRLRAENKRLKQEIEKASQRIKELIESFSKK